MDDTKQVQNESQQMMKVRVVHNCVAAFLFALYASRLFTPDLPLREALETLAVVPLVLLAEFLQKKVKNFFLFTGGLFLGTVLVFALTPSICAKIPAVIVAGAVIFLSYYARIQEIYLFYPRIGWLIGALALYGMAAMIGSSPSANTIFFYELITAILVLIVRSEESCEFTIGQIPKGGTIPYEEIRKAYRRHLYRWSAGAGAALLVLYIAHSGEALFNAVRTLLIGIVKGIFIFIIWILSHFMGDEEAAEEEAAAAAEQMDFGAGAAEEVNPLFQIIYRVLIVALIIFVVVVLIAVLRLVFKNLFISFRAAEIRGTDKAEFYSPKQESGKQDKKEDAGKIRFLDRSPSAGIRRGYSKLIRSGINLDEIRKSDTPRELEEKTQTRWTEQGTAARTVHRLYEKARYVPDDCTEADLTEMKKNLKILKGN